MFKRVTVLALAAALLLVPAPSSAVTLPDIVSLSRAGVSDAVLIALIEREPPILSIDDQQTVALRDQGVSDAVLLALLHLPPAPQIIVVGHDPDRPTGTPSPDAASDAPALLSPYFFAVPIGQSASAASDRRGCMAMALPDVSPHVIGIASNGVGHIATSGVGHITTSGVGHITTSGVGHITSSGVGHITTVPAATLALPAAPCEHPAPRVRARRHQ